MLITRKSPRTGLENTLEINVTQQQIESWLRGMHIQRAMPNLTPDEREFIMTGYTKEDWDIIFRDVIEDDDNDEEIEE